MSRGSYLQYSEQRLLNDWGVTLRRAWSESFGPFLVGSSIERPDFRDVDVRLMLADEAFDALTAIIHPEYVALAFSLWGQQVTGLPIDFQIQRTTEANVEFNKPRHALGIAAPNIYAARLVEL